MTHFISTFAVSILKKHGNIADIWVQTEQTPLFGNISFVGAETTYPEFNMCIISAIVALCIIFLLSILPVKSNPIFIYLILNAAIHLVSSLWFLFGERHFPYTITIYSELYILQEIGIWTAFYIMTVSATGIIGNGGIIYKLLTVAAVLSYSILFGIVRYIVFIFLLYRYSAIYMALFYFTMGPMFDFLYMVMIYAVFINRMIKLYDSRKGKGAWEWS